MSYVVFCKGKTAKKPYVVKDLKLRLYSMEELCYYIYNNSLLCDEELMRPELSYWIKDECGLPDLYASIDVVLHKDPKAERVAAQIFAYMDYLTKPERESVCTKIRKAGTLGINERKKSRGDMLYLEERYNDAIRVYEDLIEKKAYDDERMYHHLLYNIGCCYGNMFYYDIAYEWFMKAAAINIEKGEDIIAALFCKRMTLSGKEWERFLESREELASYAPSMENQREIFLKEQEKEKPAGGYGLSLTKRMKEWKSRIE